MYRLILMEKKDVISEILKNTLPNISMRKITNIDEFWANYGRINPSYLILDESFNDVDPLEFCKIIREKYSLVLPILILLNFHSTVDVEKLKSLGIDYLVKPFNKEELIEKIESQFKSSRILPELKETVSTEKPQVSYEEIAEKIKPIIKQEVKVEISTILKQFLEVLEKKNV